LATERATLSAAELTAKYGRWYPWNRYNVDQVPCRCEEGDGRTYNTRGDKEHVWVAGLGSGDAGKRFLTLQVTLVPFNGEGPRRGQPKLELCFRGKGKIISDWERKNWHPDVFVRFQPKAWYDEPTCYKWAAERFPGITKEARLRGEESALFADNLYGQQTQEFNDLLWRVAATKLHLLPSGVTDLVQLVDAGFGAHLKMELGEVHNTWMMKPNNLAKWIGKMEAKEKRVHMTHMAAQAMENACQTYDFEKAGRSVGMLMTADGSGDGDIKLQGVDLYTFCDEDGGSDGGSDEEELDEEEDIDVNVNDDMEKALGNAGSDEEDDEEAASGSDAELSDEEDDTAEKDEEVASQVGPAFAPPGFTIETDTPTISNNLIGKFIMYKWTGQVGERAEPLRATEFNWYLGKVCSKVTGAYKKQHPDTNFWVKHTNKQTNNILPGPGRFKDSQYMLKLELDNWGCDGQWVVVGKD